MVAGLAGPILSNILCSLVGAAVLLHVTETTFLLPSTLVSETKRNDRATMVRLYGPMTGLQNVDVFGGFLVLCIFLPVIFLVWASNASANLALTTCICLATAQPYLCLVGFYMTFCRLLPGLGPLYFAAMSGTFGFFGLLWRLLDRESSGLDGRNVPLVIFWHGLWSAIMVRYVLRMRSRIPYLKNSIRLELQKKEALENDPGVTWPADADGLVGFRPTPLQLEAMSNIEQASARYTPWYFVASSIALLILSVLWGVNSEKGQELHEVHGQRIILCVTLPLIILWIIALSGTVVAYERFGLGQTIREPLVASSPIQTYT